MPNGLQAKFMLFLEFKSNVLSKPLGIVERWRFGHKDKILDSNFIAIDIKKIKMYCLDYN